MARREELLISRSRIFRSVRALAAGSFFPLSDLSGLWADAWVSAEVEEWSLNMRGRGSDGEVIGMRDSDGDIVSDDGYRSRGGVLAVSTLADLICPDGEGLMLIGCDCCDGIGCDCECRPESPE